MKKRTLAILVVLVSCSTPEGVQQDLPVPVADAADGIADLVLPETSVPDMGPELVVDLLPETLADLPGELPADIPPELVNEVVEELAGDEVETVVPFCGDGECGEDEGCDSCENDCGICTECGNGICEGGQPEENPEVCPEDCGSCGDGVCGVQEQQEEHFCPADCAMVCGDGVCGDLENDDPGSDGYCPPDCGGCGDGCCGYKDLFDPDLAWCKDVDCSVWCGDGECAQGEDWQVCPVDCGWCGDGVCGNVWDEEEPCPADCTKPCGDGICNGNETAQDCPSDCGPCGDGICGLGEQMLGSCPWDCPPECGNDKCEEWESPVACPDDCGCVPLCDPSWECGLDAAGCGQPCGLCPQGAVCADRMCCVPDVCKGKQCGDDGCDGVCGACPVGWNCVGGTCAPPDCEPDCSGKECGDNGCGGSCGDCDDGLYCTEDSCSSGACEYQTAPLYCLIEGGCVASGFLSPQSPCHQCQPVQSQAQWTYVQDGMSCGEGMHCFEGACCNHLANCEGKECGDDGCGALCGGCEPGWGCVDAVCVDGAPCVPHCGVYECGDDGCGGSCGDCDDALLCTMDECVAGMCFHAPEPLYCVIDETCFASGAVNPGNGCEKCKPALSQDAWSPGGGGVEEVCDGVDNNCNGQEDEGFPDSDVDGTKDCVDNCPGVALAKDVCDNLAPSGGWSIAPSPIKNCGVGFVNFNVGSMNFSDNGTTLAVTLGGGFCCQPSGASADAGIFSAQCTCPGTCNETYSVAGEFTGADSWTGTFNAEYSGGACLDCNNEQWDIDGSR